jgi:hypothetical protein
MIENPPPTDEASDNHALLVDYLSQHEESCPRCGYNLKMLTGDRCPECGDRLRLRVGLVEARLKAYIAAVVACCLGFGGAFFFLVIILCYAPRSYWEKNLSPWLMIVQSVITGSLMVLLLTRRMWFTRKPQGHQWGLTAILWLVTLVMSGLALVMFDT